MSIRSRFTITLTLLGILLFGGYSVFDYYHERDDLIASTGAELQIVGRSLQVSLGNALRDKQRMDVDETFRMLEGLPPNVSIHVREVGAVTARSSKAVPDESIDKRLAVITATQPDVIEFRTDDAVYIAPLTSDRGELLGAVAVVRPLDDLFADLERTRMRMIWLVLVFGCVTSGIGLLLGTYYISRPTRAVLEGIGHVRDGDFHARIPKRHDDEIGVLVDEFNAMAGVLEEARQRAQHATEAHLRLERGLQRVDKMITIGQLSAGVAHEIGSPLQVLRGRASGLREVTSDPEVRRQAQILVEQTDRISRIVEQLLSFGRRRPATLARCKLSEPVKAVVELLAGEAKRAGVTLTVDSSDLEIDADADQLQQIVLNLVRNALAVTPRGGTIEVRVSDGGADLVRLVVRDSGPGISPEMKARMFEPFFTTRASEGGTGLGLAVVRSIVLDHGGMISVQSELGHGAEFTVTLPRHADDVGRSVHA